MKNKDNYTLVSKSNGYTVIIKRTNGNTTKYTTKQKEQYVVPFTFNAFHRKQELINKGIKEKASVVLQSLSYLGIKENNRAGFNRIMNFKQILPNEVVS